mmetsp:Transcript_58183/g.137162  ORF Transcript_58183/g.137162 Transcript_58183/m.137162 type:complete len:231 (+) Transcript_58183:316-1008(+)
MEWREQCVVDAGGRDEMEGGQQCGLQGERDDRQAADCGDERWDAIGKPDWSFEYRWAGGEFGGCVERGGDWGVECDGGRVEHWEWRVQRSGEDDADLSRVDHVGLRERRRVSDWNGQQEGAECRDDGRCAVWEWDIRHDSGHSVGERSRAGECCRDGVWERDDCWGEYGFCGGHEWAGEGKIDGFGDDAMGVDERGGVQDVVGRRGAGDGAGDHCTGRAELDDGCNDRRP